MAKKLNEWTATGIAAAVSKGEVTSEAVTRACLDRVTARENEVGAWTYIDPDQALIAARDFDRRGGGGPLAGVPFGIKDIVDTADMPTEWGSAIHRGRHAHRDAACVALSRKAGGIAMGKTVTMTFPDMTPGKTRNPRDATRSPGGSSSGSAAAVADFMVPLAIGTQTTGSTIRPASFCGVVGYRPTYGEHRLHGVLEVSASLDTLGILARTVEDVALYRDVLLGSPHRPIPDDAPPPRVAFCRTHLWDQVGEAARAATETAVAGLARAGATVLEVEMPEEFRRPTETHRWIAGYEFARVFTWEIEHHLERINEFSRERRIADGLRCDFDTYIEMVEFAERCRARMDGMWEDYDVIVTPAATDEAPVGWDAIAGAPWYMMWTALHLPVVSVPVLSGANGMPIGLQVFARRHRDRELFAAARWIYRQLS